MERFCQAGSMIMETGFCAYLSGFAMLQPLYDKRPISENQRRRPWM
ncbi:predicted protein [Brucella abortus]|uniref:Uncharacterized protein n=4 Tax=Brucella TaxID=234 RepID=Q2YQ83_BRUA2|nr:Hypothetical protein, conserved [Brucella canis ATCC 23365]ACO00772.1 Hypothetical protein, conserved [Brucella melitensis ATCC 23457]ACU47969.1 hypothetical protein BMI_I989 [Brucella microti CCM 4915]AEK54303.1 hypothetical protein BPI_I1027 [Brucella pinnipedialis B2/94]EFM60709.1 Hypothetical protein BIBO2_0275 [Brucella sp. BO2]CAJ10963.1 conserved hypothetical protein [Brucella abortus 2308]CDL76385.1 unnamed protein product [Brucella canis str. Oliveri]SHO30791.1 predicted protein 